jgi:hypothetical protein
MLKSFDPFQRVLSLVNPITNVPRQRGVLVRVPGIGFGSEARLRVTMRVVVTTTLMVT